MEHANKIRNDTRETYEGGIKDALQLNYDIESVSPHPPPCPLNARVSPLVVGGRSNGEEPTQKKRAFFSELAFFDI